MIAALIIFLAGGAELSESIMTERTTQQTTASAADSAFSANYFALPRGISSLSEIDFYAKPDASGTVSRLAYASGTDPFWSGGPSDRFAAHYTATLNIEQPGSYTFYLTSDDGSALLLDGVRVIDNDRLHDRLEKRVTLDLHAGTHALEVLYFENKGKQVLTLDWSGPDTGGTRQVLEGSALAPAEPSPAPEPANAAPTATDDMAETAAGQAVTIDVLANDADPDGDPLEIAELGTAANGSVELVGGQVRYTPEAGFDGTDSFTYTVADGQGGTDTATVEVHVAAPLPETGGFRAAYFALPGGVASLSEIDFAAVPDATGTVARLYYASGTDPFWSGGPDDRFAAHYTATLTIEQAGSYTFHLTSDDGSALLLDGVRVIDNDGLHPAAEQSLTLELDAGTHALEVLYFENGGNQVLTFDWSGPDTGGTRQVLEGSALAPAEPSPAPEPEPEMVDGGRVTKLIPEGQDISGIRLLDQPAHGHASINPDNTIALVMTRSEHVGALDLQYELSHADGTATVHVARLDVVPGAQDAGWGTSENHYMLATDAADRVIVEYGDLHRKVYVSESGLTTAAIAALEEVSEETVTAEWLRDTHPDYGATEDTALAPNIGFGLWNSINPRGSECSNWLLLERGGSYDLGRLYPQEASGESELHPMFIGAWGEGGAPVVTSPAYMFQNSVKHIVTQDIAFDKGVKIFEANENILFDNVSFSGEESVIQGVNGRHTGITIRNSALIDAWRTEVVDGDGDGFWDPHAGRHSGLYADGIDGLLLDGVIFDHNGWAPDFAENGSVDGGHPPSAFSHNLYVQWNTTDVTMRDSITMRGASVGAQLRGGAHVEDNIFIQNNVAFNVNGGTSSDPVGNYSLLNGNLVTSAAARGAEAPLIGALDWGIRNEAQLTTLIDNIVAHANDPDDPSDMVSGSSANHREHGDDGIFTDDTIIWRWGDEDANVGGLDPEVLNATTIQRYAADLLSTDAATIGDMAQYLRSLDGAEYAAATGNILDYFRAGFSLEDAPRNGAATLRFVPDVRGEGVRWDNRINWDSGDLPGTVAGDSVDLGGNQVIFGGTVTLDNMTFGPAGGLTATHGRLDVTGTLTGGAGATLDIDRAGQVWLNGTAGTETLSITVDGGRFANTGTFDSPVRLAANGGQTILATGGAEFLVDTQSRIDISGAVTRIGFDGDDDTTAILRFETGATLGFTAKGDALATLGEFRSGAFGSATAVQSGVDLGGTELELDLTGLTATSPLELVSVDELVGSFGALAIKGLGNRDATIEIDYNTDTVLLHLTPGSGQTTISQIGTEDMVDPGYAALWDMLSMDATISRDPLDF